MGGMADRGAGAVSRPPSAAGPGPSPPATQNLPRRRRGAGLVRPDAKNRELPAEVVVLSFVSGSVAQRLGLAPGDRIVSYDGKRPTSVDQVVKLVNELSGSAIR